MEKLIRVKGVLKIERGERFPTEEKELKKLFAKLKIQNVKKLSDLIIALENFRGIVDKKRFKL